MMMPGPGAATPPTPPMGGAAGAAPGASPQPNPAGGPPGGMGSLLGMMPGSVPSAASDPAEAMRIAMSGLENLRNAIKSNPMLIEVLGAVMKTDPMMRLVFLAASRRPEERAVASQASGAGRVPPILGR